MPAHRAPKMGTARQTFLPRTVYPRPSRDGRLFGVGWGWLDGSEDAAAVGIVSGLRRIRIPPWPTAARAQVGLANSGPFDQREIESVTVRIINPSPDAAFNQRIEDAVRRGVRLFPGQRYSDEAISLALAQVTRRNPQIAKATYEPFPSVDGRGRRHRDRDAGRRRAAGRGPRHGGHRATRRTSP